MGGWFMMLMRAAGRTALGGVVTALTLVLAGQAWAQDCTDARIRDRAVSTNISPSANFTLNSLATASVPQLEVLVQDCTGTLTASRNNSTPALMCVARAQLELAKRDGQNQTTLFNNARCHLYRASALRNSNVRTEADGLRAEAVLGLRRVDPGRAAVYDAELRELHASAGSGGSPTVHAAIADMLVRENNDSAATAEVNAHLQGAARARGLIAVADLQVAAQRPEAARETLRMAVSADNSVATNTALGRVYYRLGNSPDARTHLERALALTATEADQAYLPDANYYLSLVLARENPTRAAQLARDAGPSKFEYQRQACLMQLVIGGETVFSRARGPGNEWVYRPVDSLPGYAACNNLGNSAEARLLRAMFWMRRAQFFMPPPALGTPAQRAYQREVANATEALNIDVESTVALNWPGHAVTNERPSMRDMFEYGRGLSAYFDGICLGASRPNDRGSGAASVFSYYGLGDCAPGAR